MFMLECPLNYAVRVVYVTYGAMFIDGDDTINMPITLFILQENKTNIAQQRLCNSLAYRLV